MINLAHVTKHIKFACLEDDKCLHAGFLFIKDQVSSLFWRRKNESSDSGEFIFSRVHRTLQPALSIRLSVGLSIKLYFFSRVHATLQPALSVGRSVDWSVGRSVTLYFFYHIYFSKSFLSHSKAL